MRACLFIGIQINIHICLGPAYFKTVPCQLGSKWDRNHLRGQLGVKWRVDTMPLSISWHLFPFLSSEMQRQLSMLATWRPRGPSNTRIRLIPEINGGSLSCNMAKKVYTKGKSSITLNWSSLVLVPARFLKRQRGVFSTKAKTRQRNDLSQL